MSQTEPLLEVDDISKSFDEKVGNVVDQVRFSVKNNEIFALLGPSGCGKTTTLRIIAGLEHADSGIVKLAGKVLCASDRSIPPEQRGIGLVFQEYALFPHLTVLNNVIFGLKSIPKAYREEKAVEILCMMGLRDHLHRNPHELSGGQQQRVALARAIAPMPKMIMFDEPFSNLDAVLRQSTRDDVRALLKKAGMGALLVTHDQEEALSFADRIAVMNEGRIEQIGTPEEVYYRPRTQFVAQFLGRTNLISAEAHGEYAKTEFGNVKLDRPAHGKVLLSIRPEHLTLVGAEDGTPLSESGEVVTKDFKGHDITYRVRIRTRECLVHTDNMLNYEAGDRVIVSPLEKAVVLEDIEQTEEIPDYHDIL